MDINGLIQETACDITVALSHNGVISGIAAGKLRPDRDVVCAVNETGEPDVRNTVHRDGAGSGEIGLGAGGGGNGGGAGSGRRDDAIVHRGYGLIAGGPGDGLVCESPGVDVCGESGGSAAQQFQGLGAQLNGLGSVRGHVCLAPGGDNVQTDDLVIELAGIAVEIFVIIAGVVRIGRCGKALGHRHTAILDFPGFGDAESL